MCKSIRDGGQRCAAHTRLREQNTRERLDALGEDPSTHPSVYARAHDTWVWAAVEYASTAEGQEMSTRREAEALGEGQEEHAALLHTIGQRGAGLRAANTEAAAVIKDRAARAASSGSKILPDDAHWTCQACLAEGEGDAPAICPSCSHDDVCTFLRTA